MFLRRKKKGTKENPFQDKVAGKIASGFIKVQVKFSEGMNKVFTGMNTRKLKFFLVVFCILCGGFSIYFFVHAIVSKPTPSISIDPIHVPQHFDQSGDEVMENVMPEDIFRQIQDYKYYMDSMGLPIRQSLLDSMKVLEEIYLQQ